MNKSCENVKMTDHPMKLLVWISVWFRSCYSEPILQMLIQICCFRGAVDAYLVLCSAPSAPELTRVPLKPI